MKLLNLFLIAIICSCFLELICGKAVEQAVLEEKKVVRQERAKEYAKKKEEKFKSKKEQNKKAAELKKNDTKVPKEKAKPKKVVKQHTPGQKYKKEWNTHDESL